MHVAQVEGATLGGTESHTQTHGIAAEVEGEVVHVIVAQVIVGALPSATHGQPLADVPLHTCIHLHGALVDEILLVALLLTLLVEIVVPTCIDAHALHGCVLTTQGKNAGKVLAHLTSVGKLAQQVSFLASHLSGKCVHLCLVLQLELGGSLKLGSQVPVAVHTPVDADNGLQGEACLVTVERNTVVLQVYRALQARKTICCIGWNVIAGIHILHKAVIVVAGINSPQSQRHGQIVEHLISTTSCNMELIVASLHVGAEVIAIPCGICNLIGYFTSLFRELRRIQTSKSLNNLLPY